MAFTIDIKALQWIAMFEKTTHAEAKDAFEDKEQKLIFVVQPGNLFKAIGKGGSTVHRLEKMFQRKIRVIEYAEALEDFIANVVYPVKCRVQVKDDLIVLVPEDSKGRGMLIGRAATQLRNTEMIVQRYFPIKRIVVTQVQEQI